MRTSRTSMWHILAIALVVTTQTVAGLGTQRTLQAQQSEQQPIINESESREAAIQRQLQLVEQKLSVRQAELAKTEAELAKLRELGLKGGEEQRSIDDRRVAAEIEHLKKAKQQLTMHQAELAKAQQELAKQERERSLPPLDNAELKIFALKSLPAPNAANAIEDLFGAGAMRVSVDNRSNSLIVLGNQDSLRMIEALLMNLDQKEAKESGKKQPQPPKAVAKQSLLLRLFWLADGLPEGEGTDPLDVLPVSVLRATQKLGLTNPRLVTQSVSSLAAGGNDSTEFSAAVPALLFKQSSVLTHGGKVTLADNEQAAVAMHVDVQGLGVNCSLQGSLAMPLGHYMVLGTANTVIPKTAQKPTREEMGFSRIPGREFAPDGGRGIPGEAPAEGEILQPEMKFDTSRFAIVVQVIQAESFAPEDSK